MNAAKAAAKTTAKTDPKTMAMGVAIVTIRPNVVVESTL
jgi:hypothetical protein